MDYCGYPVLPMAVEQNILLAVAPSVENVLRLCNVNAKYKAFDADLDHLKYAWATIRSHLYYV